MLPRIPSNHTAEINEVSAAGIEQRERCTWESRSLFSGLLSTSVVATACIGRCLPSRKLVSRDGPKSENYLQFAIVPRNVECPELFTPLCMIRMPLLSPCISVREMLICRQSRVGWTSQSCLQSGVNWFEMTMTSWCLISLKWRMQET